MEKSEVLEASCSVGEAILYRQLQDGCGLHCPCHPSARGSWWAPSVLGSGLSLIKLPGLHGGMQVTVAWESARLKCLSPLIHELIKQFTLPPPPSNQQRAPVSHLGLLNCWMFPPLNGAVSSPATELQCSCTSETGAVATSLGTSS